MNIYTWLALVNVGLAYLNFRIGSPVVGCLGLATAALLMGLYADARGRVE